ncbi:MAG: heavy-metal-associated domain-containing protein [candidate division Zixibacteria bacterium]|nr:heavy-metal-associated domain-containing protein [candidate division Zixibacteria bacterium]
MYTRQLFLLGLLVVCLALVVSPVLAGSNCGKKGTTSCASTCATPCPISKTASATAPETPANPACADYKGTCEHLTLTVSGIADDTAEAELKKTLAGQDGVITVTAVDRKGGTATVCFDPQKTKADKLAQVVVKAGYKAEVALSQICTHDKTAASACPMMKASAGKSECPAVKTVPATSDNK